MHLITETTDPPPSSEQSEGGVDEQIPWHTKKLFLSLGLARLDVHNVDSDAEGENPTVIANGKDRKAECEVVV